MLLCVWNVTAQTYEVTILADPPEACALSGSGIYEHGSLISLSALDCLGGCYKFLHWEINGAILAEDPVLNGVPVFNDLMIIAKFELITAIEDLDVSAVTVYPNPTTGMLQVTGNGLRVTSIEIFDIYGRKVSYLTTHISNQVNISHLPAGIYFVCIATEKGAVVRKVVKQ
jgi:hypothetical protein